MPVTISEIGMAAPDIIHFKVKDGAVGRGELVRLLESDPSHPTNSQVQRTNPTNGQLEWCRVGGKDGTWLRFFDTVPDAFADRVALDNASNYPSFGGRTVTNVRRITMSCDQGICRSSSGGQLNFGGMEHWMFLELSGSLPNGVYSLSITGNTFPATTFKWNDKKTVSPAIHATQIGHRPNDGSKRGYLSLWIEGYGSEHGAVDYATTYSVSAFHVINSGGDVLHTGTLNKRVDHNEPETGVNAIRYPDTTVVPKKITGITQANPGVVTIAGHGYTTGQYKMLAGIGGMTQLERAKVQITVIDPNAFSIGVDTSSYGAYVADTYTAAIDSLCYDLWQSNRAGTHVWEADYSSFSPASSSEDYYLYIPGIGVSHPFKIDEAIHYIAAKNGVKGYINQCWGMDVNEGMGGWNRPENFRDGKNGAEVYESLIPACLVQETGLLGSPYAQNSVVEEAPWSTSNRITDWFGGWSDAGDWDFHLWRHAQSMFHMLDLGFERLPAAGRNLSFGFPKSSQTIGGIYDASTDSMPDVFHMIIWYMEPFRRFQKADGRVYGGLNYSGAEGGGNDFFPSFTHQETAYCLEADHAANFCYCYLAVKLGRLLKAEGFTTLGQIWVDSAEDAWTWANDIFTDYNSSDISGQAFIDHYLTGGTGASLDIQTKLGWDNTTLKAAFDLVANIADSERFLAAAAMFAEKGTTTYSDIVEARFAVAQGGTLGIGAWEYIHATGANQTQIDYYNARWNITPDTLLGAQISGNAAYRTGTPGDFPSPAAIMHTTMYSFLKDSPADETSDYLKILHDAEGYVSGANQSNICLTTGIGKVPPTLLLRDREAMGLDSNDVPGITVFGYWWDGGPGLAVFNWATDSPLNFTADRLTGNHEADFGSQRLIEPNPASVPACQAHWRNTYMIYHTEYGTTVSVCSRIANNIFRHAWDGNTVTELTNAPISGSISF